MLIGLAGDPLKKNPGLLKQDSTRTSQDSQREPSVHRGLLVLSGTCLKKEQSLDAWGPKRADLSLRSGQARKVGRYGISRAQRAIRSESGARWVCESLLHFREDALGRFTRIRVAGYRTAYDKIICTR